MIDDENLYITDDLDDVEEETFEDSDSDFSGLSSALSTELCDIIIAFRYLGVFKERAIASMKELVRRREEGENFKFEEYIQNEISNLPKLDLNVSTNSFALPFSAFTKKK